jgi:hypothetical protein
VMQKKESYTTKLFKEVDDYSESLRKHYANQPSKREQSLLESLCPVTWDNYQGTVGSTVLVPRQKVEVATQKVEVVAHKVGLATLSPLPPPPGTWAYYFIHRTNFALWKINNRVKPDYLRVTKHDSIQDHCRDVILRHLNHEDQIEELELPRKLKRFITEALSDDSQ